MKLLRLLIECIHRRFTIPVLDIPLTISDQETIIRGIFHPLFVKSGGRLKREAFLPPPSKNDISTLRLDFCDTAYCKRRIKTVKIRGHVYQGFAIFLARHINQLTPQPPLQIEIRATPLNIFLKYRKTKKIRTIDFGVPVHSDILFSQPLVRSEPNTLHRKYADEMLKTARFIEDPEPSSDEWIGDELRWIA